MQIVWCLGGLANQMMQYAFARRIQLDGYDVKLDSTGFEDYPLHNGFELNRIFNIKIDNASVQEVRKIKKRKGVRKLRTILGLSNCFIEQKGFTYSDEYIPKHDNCYIKGYWNSEKFFLPYRDQIIKDFTFPEFTENHNLDLHDKILNEESISIHVRRGDYVNHPLHGGVCTLQYYKNSIEYIKERAESPSFYIFSNDITWCRNELSQHFGGLPVIYVTENTKGNSFRDIQLMSLCKYNVVANSGFSWWGAYLNQNGKNATTISPDHWVSGDHAQGDFIPDGWAKLSTSE